MQYIKMEGRFCTSPDAPTELMIFEVQRYENTLIYNCEIRGYEISIKDNEPENELYK